MMRYSSKIISQHKNDEILTSHHKNDELQLRHGSIITLQYITHYNLPSTTFAFKTFLHSTTFDFKTFF